MEEQHSEDRHQHETEFVDWGSARTTAMIPVLTRVARSESTPARPTFAKMAVIAANTAESNAQTNHVAPVSMGSLSKASLVGTVTCGLSEMAV